MKVLDELERLQKAAQEAATTNRSLESLFLHSDFESLGRSALPALIRVARAAECMYERNIYTVELEDALQQLRDLGGKE